MYTCTGLIEIFRSEIKKYHTHWSSDLDVFDIHHLSWRLADICTVKTVIKYFKLCKPHIF